MRYHSERRKRSRCDWRRNGTAVVRGVCCVVTVVVLTVFAWRLGQGIQRVRHGEITSAQMLQDMGQWLRGKENKTEGND